MVWFLLLFHFFHYDGLLQHAAPAINPRRRNDQISNQGDYDDDDNPFSPLRP